MIIRVASGYSGARFIPPAEWEPASFRPRAFASIRPPEGDALAEREQHDAGLTYPGGWPEGNRDHVHGEARDGLVRNAFPNAGISLDFRRPHWYCPAAVGRVRARIP